MRPVEPTDDIKAGMQLYDDNPLYGMQPVTVQRTTKTLIITNNDVRYSRSGYLSGDTYRRKRLHIQEEQ